jgi:hypothetical protein
MMIFKMNKHNLNRHKICARLMNDDVCDVCDVLETSTSRPSELDSKVN